MWLNISHDLTTELLILIIIKLKKKKHITLTSVKMKETMNYFLHQKLIIKPIATKSLTSRKGAFAAIS